MGRKLNFFTAKYPYGNGESIIENELPITSKAFESVRIFPHFFDLSTHPTRQINKNNEIFQLSNYVNQKLSLKDYYLIFRFFTSELFLTHKKRYYLKNYRRWLSYLKIAAKKSNELQNIENLFDNAVNYSYWMNDWALVLVFLKRKKVINNFVFRCGGFDIWDERHEGGYLPFRGLIYKYANSVYPNTKLGEEYIKSLNLYSKKVKCKYLGTTDYSLGKFEENKDLVLLSVSNVIPLKRLHLIVEILKKVNTKVKWVHFGAGEELNELKNKVKNLSNKHEIIFKGQVSNKELLDYYTKNTVHLLINVSSSEGLPVSIQEAISFGVPIMATNVGGVSEIVNEKTGLLLEKDFVVNEAVKFIDNLSSSKFNTLEQRKKIRQYWKNNFEAEKVYKDFVEDLKMI